MLVMDPFASSFESYMCILQVMPTHLHIMCITYHQHIILCVSHDLITNQNSAFQKTDTQDRQIYTKIPKIDIYENCKYKYKFYRKFRQMAQLVRMGTSQRIVLITTCQWEPEFLCTSTKCDRVQTKPLILIGRLTKTPSYGWERNSIPFSQDKNTKHKQVTKYHNCLSSSIVYHPSLSVICHCLLFSAISHWLSFIIHHCL